MFYLAADRLLGWAFLQGMCRYGYVMVCPSEGSVKCVKSPHAPKVPPVPMFC